MRETSSSPARSGVLAVRDVGRTQLCVVLLHVKHLAGMYLHGSPNYDAHLLQPNAIGTLRRKMKSRKVVYDASTVQEYSADEVLPYEEVVKIAPQNNRPRPLLLVSAHSEVNTQAIINHIILNQAQGLFSMPGKRSQPSSVAHSNVIGVHEVLQVMDSGKTSIFSIPPQVRL